MADYVFLRYKGVEYDESIPWIKDDRERWEAVGKYLIAARDRHVETMGQIVPGFIGVGLHDPITLDSGITLKTSMYLVDAREEANADFMYTLTPTEETLKKMAQAAEEGDERQEGGKATQFKMNISRISRGPSGTPLRYIEVLMAYALEDAEGNEHLQRFILRNLTLRSGKYVELPRRDLPRQDVRKLHRQNDPISKVVHVMTNPALFGEEGAKVDVASEYEKSRGKEIRTAVTFSWDGEGVKIYRPISQYDREIHGAVSSLWADGQRVVTAAQVAKAMGIRNPTSAQTKKAAESVDLQRRVLGKIDYTEEARGRSLTFEGEPVSTFKLEGNLIAADKTEIETANGRIVEGYILHRAPLMYQHAAALGQVVNYPQRLLGLGDGRDTEQNIILRRELLRRVYRIKSNYKKARTDKKRQEVNRKIRFTTDSKHPERCLFEAANVNQKDRHARKKALDYVIGILDGLAEDGEIADYKPTTETGRGGTRTVGAEIILIGQEEQEGVCVAEKR